MSRLATIEATLKSALEPVHLEVVNESHMHSVKPGSETHFKVVIVAPAFESLGLLARHRKVNELLSAELAAGLHALSIHALSPSQWEAGGHDLSSPACRGGMGK
ncbi:MAG: BolA family protein [Polyangia bacterium]